MRTAFILLCLFALQGFGQVVKPEIRDTVLLVHEDYTAARQIQRTLVRQGTHDMFLADFPDTVDPSTLLLGSKEIDFKINSWRTDNENSSRWIPNITSGIRGVYPIRVSYLFTGISWSADYFIRFRFSSEEQPRVSCVFFGGVELRNLTDIRFENAQIRLIQSDLSENSEQKGKGFFMMNPLSPLSELWTSPEGSDEPVERELLLNRRVSLPSGEQVGVQLINSQRVKAKRLFRNNVSEQYLSEHSMDQIMVIENTRENGLGITLPAGVLHIEGAKGSSGLQGQSIWPHTRKNETAEIYIGSIEEVTGKKLPERLIRREQNGFETDFRIQLINRFDFPVDVEWIEEPESSYTWTVLSSDVPYLVEDRKLVFSPTLEANSDLIIQYQLQYKRPSLVGR